MCDVFVRLGAGGGAGREATAARLALALALAFLDDFVEEVVEVPEAGSVGAAPYHLCAVARCRSAATSAIGRRDGASHKGAKECFCACERGASRGGPKRAGCWNC